MHDRVSTKLYRIDNKYFIFVSASGSQIGAFPPCIAIAIIILSMDQTSQDDRSATSGSQNLRRGRGSREDFLALCTSNQHSQSLLRCL